MGVGDIGSVLDTLEFDTGTGQYPHIIQVSGNIFAIAYGGGASDGWLCTVDIDSAGTIADAVIDTLEFDTTACINPKIIHVSGDIYAIAYEAETNIEIATVSIDSAGNIGAAVIDTFQSTDSSANIEMGSIIHISGDIYAIAYNDVDYHGKVITVDIDSAGTITASEVDTLEFDTSQGMAGSLIYISGTMYAVAYSGPGNDGWAASFTITNAGVIADAVTATLEFDTDFCSIPRIVHVSGDYFAIAYKGTDSDGFVKTLTINSAGAIGAVASTLEFDTSDCVTPDIINVGGTVFAVAYEGVDGDGFVKTFTIDSSGNIGTVIGSLEFDTSWCRIPSILLIPNSGGIVAIAYSGVDSDGFVKTVDIKALPSTGALWIEDDDLHYKDETATERKLQGVIVSSDQDILSHLAM